MGVSIWLTIVEMIGHVPNPRLVNAVLRVQEFDRDLSDTLDIEITREEEKLMEHSFRVGFELGRDPNWLLFGDDPPADSA